jgi:hypothetical protein
VPASWGAEVDRCRPQGQARADSCCGAEDAQIRCRDQGRLGRADTGVKAAGRAVESCHGYRTRFLGCGGC